jgi:hypothetical protein
MQAVARPGDAAPSGGTYAGFGASPELNAAGHVAFLAAAITGGSSPQGIFVGTPGSLQAVVLQGSAAPAGNGATFGNINGTFALNANDLVAFTSTLTGTGVTTGVNDLGLYVGSPGTLFEIVRTGDQIDEGNGSGFHTVSGISFNGGSGGEDGRGRAITDSGLLVFELSFTDGTSGIFTSQITAVPEPSALAMTGAALVGVWFRRRSFIS